MSLKTKRQQRRERNQRQRLISNLNKAPEPNAP